MIDTNADDKTLNKVANAAAEEADIIADVRGTAPYKRAIVACLCRACGAAAYVGKRRTQLMAATVAAGSQVGRSLPRLEAREKVTGRAEYTHLMQIPGMLHAKIFRSTVAHGRIKLIDTSAARSVPVFTVSILATMSAK